MFDKKPESLLSAEKVTQAANYLVSIGVSRPSANAVRKCLLEKSTNGKVGGQALLQNLLNDWHLAREAAAVDDNSSAGIPAELHAHLQRALRESANQACEKQLSETAQLREEQDALIRENRAQEEQLAELTQLVAFRTTERDALSGQIVALNVESGLVKAALTLAHDSANNAQYELGRAQSQLQIAQALAREKTLEAGYLTETAHRLQSELTASQVRTAEAIHSAKILQGKLDSQVQARESLDAAYATFQAQQVLLINARSHSLRGRGGHGMRPTRR